MVTSCHVLKTIVTIIIIDVRRSIDIGGKPFFNVLTGTLVLRSHIENRKSEFQQSILSAMFFSIHFICTIIITDVF